MIKAIVFDWGGVLKISEEKLMQKIENYLGISDGDWDKKYFLYNKFCNSGEKSFEEVFEITAKEFGASDEQISHIHEMVKENKKTWRLNSELVEIVKDLKKNYKIGLLSNNNHIKLKRELAEHNLIDLFDAVVASSEVNYQKPQPEIFQILFDKLRVKNNEVVFIDDTDWSLEGAGSIGYIPILFENNQKLKEDLEKLDINIG